MIQIHYNKNTAEYLVEFYVNGVLKNWKIAYSSTDIPKMIQEFYFPSHQ